MSEFVETRCARCKERFCLTAETDALLRRSGQSFHCPWGHPLHFSLGPSEADKLRLDRDRLKQQVAQRDDEIKQERGWRQEAEAAAKGAERRVSAARGQITKLKKRASAGICPCCNRHFQELQAHMATEHPTFEAEPIVLEP
jgi:hypothetical protein